MIEGTLQSQYAEGVNSFIQRLVELVMTSKEKIISFTDIEPKLNTCSGQQVKVKSMGKQTWLVFFQHCEVIWPRPITSAFNWYEKSWPTERQKSK